MFGVDECIGLRSKWGNESRLTSNVQLERGETCARVAGVHDVETNGLDQSEFALTPPKAST